MRVSGVERKVQHDLFELASDRPARVRTVRVRRISSRPAAPTRLRTAGRAPGSASLTSTRVGSRTWRRLKARSWRVSAAIPSAALLICCDLLGRVFAAARFDGGEMGVADDHGRQVVHVVRDRARVLPDHLHPLRMLQLLDCAPLVGDVAQRPGKLRRVADRVAHQLDGLLQPALGPSGRVTRNSMLLSRPPAPNAREGFPTRGASVECTSPRKSASVRNRVACVEPEDAVRLGRPVQRCIVAGPGPPYADPAELPGRDRGSRGTPRTRRRRLVKAIGFLGAPLRPRSSRRPRRNESALRDRNLARRRLGLIPLERRRTATSRHPEPRPPQREEAARWRPAGS